MISTIRSLTCDRRAAVYTQIAHLRPFLHTYQGAKTTPRGEVFTPGPPFLGRLYACTACLRRPISTFLCKTEVGTSWMQARARGTGDPSMILCARPGARSGARSRDWWPKMILGARRILRFAASLFQFPKQGEGFGFCDFYIGEAADAALRRIGAGDVDELVGVGAAG